MSKLFSQVGGASPPRSMFNLSHQYKTTMDMGAIVPFLCKECLPGDTWKIANDIVVRMQPMFAPLLHEVNVITNYFFVPYRLLWEDWEDFITGDGITYTQEGDMEFPEIPVWKPSGSDLKAGTLWDYFGFDLVDGMNRPVDDLCPLDFPRRAYNFIWSEYFRDEDLQDYIGDPKDPESWTDSSLKYSAWQKDYFTSARPFQQKGTAPAIPLSGFSHAQFSAFAPLQTSLYPGVTAQTYEDPGLQGNNSYSMYLQNLSLGHVNLGIHAQDLNKNTVDFSNVISFTPNDLRQAFQLQKWLERNARAGTRYTESLQAHFNVKPQDYRLQRPEYIGGSISPLIISEVLQTSATDSQISPQGNMAGHGVTANANFIGKHYCPEHGLIMGLMRIMPRPVYAQGMDRSWLRRTTFDFMWPEFLGLSEQAVVNGELKCSGNSQDNKLFGFQGRYSELRYARSQVTGHFRDDMKYWHLARFFEDVPSLNGDFISASQVRKDIFSFVGDEVHGFFVNVGNHLHASRPLTWSPEPGLIDHF